MRRWNLGVVSPAADRRRRVRVQIRVRLRDHPPQLSGVISQWRSRHNDSCVTVVCAISRARALRPGPLAVTVIPVPRRGNFKLKVPPARGPEQAYLYDRDRGCRPGAGGPGRDSESGALSRCPAAARAAAFKF
jgi:hypothetical protein